MNLTGDEIFRRIQSIFSKEFELDQELLVPEATLFDDLGLDSLDAVDMVVALEKEFGVKVKDEESIRSVRTLSDLQGLLLTIQAQMTSSDKETAA